MIRTAAIALLSLLALPAAAGEFTIEFKHDGEVRRAEIITPDHRGEAGPAPAILALHGGGGSPRRVKRYTRYTLAERGWVEIYPSGLGRQWNYGRIGADGQPLRTADDVGFLSALITKLARDGLVDAERIYIAGASNGGMMTLRLACDATDLVAGAAVIIASWPVGLDCDATTPLPVLFVHGTDDQLIRFDGGRVVGRKGKDRGSVSPAEKTLEIWAARNRCGGSREQALPDIDPDDGTKVNLRVYIDCAAPLSHYIVEGGGHTWPGRSDRWLLRTFLGRTSQDLDLTAEIEKFFIRLDDAQ